MSDKLLSVRALFAENGVPLDRDDIWSVQGTPVVKHAALERLAVALKIIFEAPQALITASDEAVLVVYGRRGDAHEWSIGEAKIVPKGSDVIGNYIVSGKQGAYPYAMAEKRGKDRVILKLARLSGVYSEDEADNFKAYPKVDDHPDDITLAQHAFIRVWGTVLASDKYTAAELHKSWINNRQERQRVCTPEQIDALKERTTARIRELNQREAPNVITQ